MTTPTREQVVQLITLSAEELKELRFSSIGVEGIQLRTMQAMMVKSGKVIAALEATIAEQAAEIATLQSKADALAELLIKSTIDEWQPGFTNREYDSDEPKENEFRELVLSALAAYKESKQ